MPRLRSLTTSNGARLQAADFLRDGATLAELTEGLAGAVVGGGGTLGEAPSEEQRTRAAQVRFCRPSPAAPVPVLVHDATPPHECGLPVWRSRCVWGPLGFIGLPQVHVRCGLCNITNYNRRVYTGAGRGC